MDSVNLIKVESILKKYGWLDKKQTGFKGNLAMTMTLQHAPLKTQVSYLPLLKKAYEEKKLSGDFLCMLEDRVNAKNKKFQYYGTQIIYYKNKPVLYPVVNIDSVNIWRKRRGLSETIESYLKYSFKTDFDIIEYKRILSELIKLRQIKDSI